MENAGALSPTFNAIESAPCRKTAPTMPPAPEHSKIVQDGTTASLLERCHRLTAGWRDMDGLLGFILAGFALAGSPGPATLSLAAAGAAFGARRSLGYMVGQITGLVVVMGVTASGM